VDVKVFENELSDEETQHVISGITDTIVSVAGEALRPHTCVLVTHVQSGNWGIGATRVVAIIPDQPPSPISRPNASNPTMRTR
jgi:4-oxalocrotonate tautomerase